jgi:hypothetical protein
MLVKHGGDFWYKAEGRSPEERGRESDGVIVPFDPEDNITSGEGRIPAVGVVRGRLGEAHCES